ncbi:MAG: carotenoid oxygenase family protein, partial [bacterium]
PGWKDYSECWIFRAQEIEKGPVTKIKVPARIPPGFHAKWVRGDELWATS